MKFSEFKKYLSNNSDDRIYLIEGDDSYFREKASEMLLKNINIAYPEINEARLNNPSVKDIEDNINILPFLSDKRIVIIKEFYPYPSEGILLKNISFENSASVLLICNTKKHAEFNKLKENITVIDCSKEEPSVLKNWIKAIFNTFNKEIELSTAEMLAIYCGQDMMKVNNEISKLGMLDKTKITESDIEQNVSKDTDYQAYMLATKASEKKGDAFKIAQDFTSKGDTASSILLIMSLYSGYKRMFYAKDSKLDKQKLSLALGVKPYAVTMSGKAAAKYKKKELKEAMEMLADCDYKIKSGNMGGETALYYSVARLL